MKNGSDACASDPLKLFLFLVRLAGFEPTTPWFVAKYSIQLSYSRYIFAMENGLAAMANPLIHLLVVGAAGRIRTHDPLVRSQVLYPTELQPLKPHSIARFGGQQQEFAVFLRRTDAGIDGLPPVPCPQGSLAAPSKQRARRPSSPSCSARAASTSQQRRRAALGMLASSATASSIRRALPHSWRSASAWPSA